MRHGLYELCKRADAALGRRLAGVPSARPRPLPDDPRDVLVVRLWGLGNLALMAPLLSAWRGRRVRLLTLARHAGFLRSQFPEAGLLLLREPPDPRGPLDLLRALRRLAADPPQVVVDAETFLRLPALGVRLACRAPIVGLDTPGQGRSLLLDARVPHDPLRHAADTFAELAFAANLPAPRGPGGLAVAPHERQRLLPLLPAGEGPLVVVHPGSGEHFPGRRWPAERFAALARRLHRTGARVVLSGVAAERALVAQVAAQAGTFAADVCGRLDVPLLLALLERADLLVANDTGPVHLADALGTPSVALYGPNAPHRAGPRHPASRALFADLPCSPCLDDRRMKRSSCRHHACLHALDVDLAFAACRAVLGRAPRESGSRHGTDAATHALAR